MENRTDLAWHLGPNVDQITSVTEHLGHSSLSARHVILGLRRWGSPALGYLKEQANEIWARKAYGTAKKDGAAAEEFRHRHS